MKIYRKNAFPVGEVRRYLEVGPALLVSSAWKGKTNIMTMGWHTVLEFSPSLVGCMISGSNHSFEMIRKSRECVLNLPTADIRKTVVGIGNCSGADTDKFAVFGLTAEAGVEVKAPLIKECYANFECKLVDGTLVKKFNFFVFEVVRALVATAPKYPETIHYRGDSIFMLSGRNIRIPSGV